MNKKSPINIFIVEDNNVFTLALKADIETAFANRPIKIKSFESGESCMKTFREEKPSVVILDYHLNSKNPNAVDGIKVLDWIKRDNNETDVIILSSDDNIEIALKSFKHGAYDYIVKSETKFRKINNSLFNLFLTRDAKIDARRFKQLGIGLLICVSLVIIGVLLLSVFNSKVLY